MSTSYTEDLHKRDVSLREFALHCAKITSDFSAQLENDAKEVQPLVPSQFLSNRLATMKNRLLYLQTSIQTSNAEPIRNECDLYNRTQLEYWQEQCRIHETVANRYYKLLGEVDKWVPPTPVHEFLRKFMLQQLESDRPGPLPTKPIVVTFEEYLQRELDSASEDIRWYQDKIDLETKRIGWANDWLNLLYQSLPAEVVTETVPESK